jgi:hypothetical protein
VTQQLAENAKFCILSNSSRNNIPTRTNIRPGAAYLPRAAKLEKRCGECGADSWA